MQQYDTTIRKCMDQWRYRVGVNSFVGTLGILKISSFRLYTPYNVFVHYFCAVSHDMYIQLLFFKLYHCLLKGDIIIKVSVSKKYCLCCEFIKYIHFHLSETYLCCLVVCGGACNKTTQQHQHIWTNIHICSVVQT